MKYSFGTFAILAAFLLAPSQGNTASAQTAISFSFSGPGGVNSSGGVLLTGSGTLNPYGPTTIRVTAMGTTSSSAAFTVTFGNGSTMSAVSTETNSGNTSTGTATITGGTGTFAGVSGSFTYVTVVTQTASAEVVNFTSTGSGTIIGSPTQISGATQFVPIIPCRIADTRNPNSAFGGPAIAGGTSRDFVIPNSVCGIPSNVSVYSLNVAVVPHGTLGFLTLWPSGQPQPLVATLNSIDGRIKSNAAMVPAGVNGAISVFATDTTDVILDINGYFAPGSTPGAVAFFPLTPCRVADTRNPTDPLGGPSLGAQSTRAFPIMASPCKVPSTAEAYSLNFAAVPKGPTLGFMTAWPVGQSQPLVASLNDPTGTVLSNAVIVPSGPGGAINVFTTDDTDLVIDINGYFAPAAPGGLSLYTLTPCRVLDSRLPAGTPPFAITRDVNVTAAPCGVPVTAQAFVFNATVVPPGLLGFITMWPQGQAQPVAATLNAYDGAITNNMAIVPATTGAVSVFPSNPTQLVLDIFGYFAP